MNYYTRNWFSITLLIRYKNTKRMPSKWLDAYHDILSETTFCRGKSV